MHCGNWPSREKSGLRTGPVCATPSRCARKQTAHTTSQCVLSQRAAHCSLMLCRCPIRSFHTAFKKSETISLCLRSVQRPREGPKAVTSSTLVQVSFIAFFAPYCLKCLAVLDFSIELVGFELCNLLLNGIIDSLVQLWSVSKSEKNLHEYKERCQDQCLH